MRLVENRHRSGGRLMESAPYPSVAATRVDDLLAQCPAADRTPLVSGDDLAPVAAFWLKDERGRMALGSFKALGAAYVIARHAAEAGGAPGPDALKGRTYVTASAGNHGMSVAAGARVFGAESVVYIAETVPEVFADRLRARSALVVREGADYAASMAAASAASVENGWILLSDSSWEGYTEIPHMLMEGYLRMASEAVRQCPQVPTDIFLQAGVGGLAGAVAAYVRQEWGDAPRIIVVEPEAAPALQASIEAGWAVFAGGPDSVMGRLDCKEPSLIALNGLARDADLFLTLSDAEVLECLPRLAAVGLETTASGGAGAAAAMRAELRDALEIGPDARILCFLTEAPE